MGGNLADRNERLSIIEQLLFKNAAGMRAVDIAEYCDVDRRTIYRDLTRLREQGIPVFQKNGRFFVNRDYYLARMRLNLHEAVTIMIAVRILLHYQQQYNPHLVAILRKLSKILPQYPSEHALAIAQFAGDQPIDRAYLVTLETIIRGWWDRTVVKIWDGKIATEFAIYFVEPAVTGDLCLVGLDMKEQVIRTLSIKQIKRVNLTKLTYSIPVNFKHEAYFADVWGMRQGLSDNRLSERVQLIFDTDAFTRIQNTLNWDIHEFERLSDGRYLLTLYVVNIDELITWIRSWGAQVEIQSPDSLREIMRQDLELTLQRYQNMSISEQRV